MSKLSSIVPTMTLKEIQDMEMKIMMQFFEELVLWFVLQKEITMSIRVDKSKEVEDGK